MDCKGMSPAYVPPEVLACSGVFQHTNPKVLDVWAMGVVLYVMLVGAFPFSSMDPAVLFQKISSACVVFPPWVHPGASDLISRMLSRNPSLRPSAREVLADKWLTRSYTAKRCASDGASSAEDDDGCEQIVPAC